MARSFIDAVADRLGVAVAQTEKLGDRLAGVNLTDAERGVEVASGSLIQLLGELREAPADESDLADRYSPALIQAALAANLIARSTGALVELTERGTETLARLTASNPA